MPDTLTCPCCLGPAEDMGRLEKSGDRIYLHGGGKYCIEENTDD